MSEAILLPLHNARRISECVPEILRNGVLARCAVCPVASCRSQLAATSSILTTAGPGRSR